MDAAQLAAAIDEVAVFARVTPSHKVKIVRALQAKGHVVAMTGDGVNDAPALKQADIGVAMGISGTAVAKEAATMVLTDDNFATIVRAVRQGRTLYDNILKFVRFQLSTTIGAILTVFFAPLAGLPEPFTPLQILWIAIIMDGPPAVSLAMDAARPGIMNEPPRHATSRCFRWPGCCGSLAYGVTMMVGTLAVLYYGMRTGSEARALTMAFTTFVLFQFFNVFNARSENGSAFNARFFDNRMLWLSLLGTLALQVVVVHWTPASELFGTTGMAVGRLGHRHRRRIDGLAARGDAQAGGSSIPMSAPLASNEFDHRLLHAVSCGQQIVRDDWLTESLRPLRSASLAREPSTSL